MSAEKWAYSNGCLREGESIEIAHKEGWIAGVEITLCYMHRRSDQET